MIRQLAVAGALAGALGVGGTTFGDLGGGGAFNGTGGAKRVSVSTGSFFKGFGSDKKDLFDSSIDPETGDRIRRIMHASELELNKTQGTEVNHLGKRIFVGSGRNTTGAKFISR